MQWDDLRVFLAVARTEGLTGAAKRLRLDPATVGRRIARIEAATGASLFSKSPQGYALTEAGQRLMPHAESAEQAASAAVEALHGVDERLAGTIRIGAPDGCANFLLPQVCARIAAENPELELQIIALPRVVNLTKREADMAITVSQPHAGRLTVQKLSDYHLHLAGHRDLLDAKPVVNRADIADHRIIGYIPDMIFDSELDYLAEAGVGPVRHASNSAAVQFNWIRAGDGLGIVHDFALQSAPELQKVLPDQIALKRTFYLVRHADDQKVVRLSRFARRLCEVFRAETARLERLA
jgi:DNA-binding transcriptional LysR family regulator